jgi:hypothetical protein
MTPSDLELEILRIVDDVVGPEWDGEGGQSEDDAVLQPLADRLDIISEPPLSTLKPVYG